MCVKTIFENYFNNINVEKLNLNFDQKKLHAPYLILYVFRNLVRNFFTLSVIVSNCQ